MRNGNLLKNLVSVKQISINQGVGGLWSVLLGKLIQTLEDTSLISTFSVVINIGLLGKKRLICYCVPTLYLKQKTYTAKMQGHVNKKSAFLSSNPNMKYDGDHHISIISYFAKLLYMNFIIEIKKIVATKSGEWFGTKICIYRRAP